MREAPTGPRQTAFVLVGGGSLGAVEVGMLKALTLTDVSADFVVGYSVGAVNGAYFAAEPTHEGALRLERIWRRIRRRDVFPVAPLKSLLGLLMKSDHMIDPAPLRRVLERFIPFGRLEETRIPCHLVAANVLGGSGVCLSSGPAVEALLASSAMPAVFPPVRMGERYLIDGVVAHTSPIAVAVELGARRVIVLPTGFACAIERPPRTALGVALHVLNLLSARQLLMDVQRFCTEVDLVIVPPLCPLSVSSFDFSHSGDLIDRAAEQTARWIQEGGLETRCVPDALYPHAWDSAGRMMPRPGAAQPACPDHTIDSQHRDYRPASPPLGQYFLDADIYPEALRASIPTDLAESLRPDRETAQASDPDSLLRLTFEGATARVRYEARRKLYLGKLLFDIDHCRAVRDGRRHRAFFDAVLHRALWSEIGGVHAQRVCCLTSERSVPDLVGAMFIVGDRRQAIALEQRLIDIFGGPLRWRDRVDMLAGGRDRECLDRNSSIGFQVLKAIVDVLIDDPSGPSPYVFSVEIQIFPLEPYLRTVYEGHLASHAAYKRRQILQDLLPILFPLEVYGDLASSGRMA